MAYRNVADTVEALDEAQREKHDRANSWQTLAGVGPKTATVIAQAWAGREPETLAEIAFQGRGSRGGDIRAATQVVSPALQLVRRVAPISRRMMATARSDTSTAR